MGQHLACDQGDHGGTWHGARSGVDGLFESSGPPPCLSGRDRYVLEVLDRLAIVVRGAGCSGSGALPSPRALKYSRLPIR